jgi:hypothetical protein
MARTDNCELGDWVIGEMAGEEMKDVDERLARWQEAFEDWLAERERLGIRVRRRGELT